MTYKTYPIAQKLEARVSEKESVVLDDANVEHWTLCARIFPGRPDTIDLKAKWGVTSDRDNDPARALLSTDLSGHKFFDQYSTNDKRTLHH